MMVKFMIKIINHIAVLHVILPLIIGLFSLIFINKKASHYLTIFACLINVALSLLFFNSSENTSFYQIGNFDYKIGISHSINQTSEKIVMYLSVLMLMFLIRKKSIYRLSENLKLPHLFYFLLLINYTGLIGIILTNDIFNTYVFIEVTSLTSYALSVINNKERQKFSLVAGINYLLYGSFAATLILFGIGIILFSCGSLSIKFLQENPQILNQDPVPIIGILSIFFGFLLKIGIMPFNFVVSSVYRFSSSIIVQYLLSTAFLANFSALGKFYELIKIPYLFTSVGVLSMLISSYFALKTKHLRQYLTYVIFASNGMSFVAFEIFETQNLKHLFIYYIIFDSINKFGLFLVLSILEKNLQNKKTEITFWDLIYINDNKILLSTFLVVCTSIIGLPFTVGFASKLSLYKVLVIKNNYFLLGILLLCNILSIAYVFRLINHSYLVITDNKSKTVSTKLISIDRNTRFVLVFTILALIITCFYV